MLYDLHFSFCCALMALLTTRPPKINRRDSFVAVTPQNPGLNQILKVKIGVGLKLRCHGKCLLEEHDEGIQIIDEILAQPSLNLNCYYIVQDIVMLRLYEVDALLSFPRLFMRSAIISVHLIHRCL